MLYIVEIKRPDDKKWGLPTCHYKLKDAKEYVAQNRRSFPSTNYRISKYRKVD